MAELLRSNVLMSCTKVVAQASFWCGKKRSLKLQCQSLGRHRTHQSGGCAEPYASADWLTAMQSLIGGQAPDAAVCFRLVPLSGGKRQPPKNRHSQCAVVVVPFDLNFVSLMTHRNFNRLSSLPKPGELRREISIRTSCSALHYEWYFVLLLLLQGYCLSAT